MRGDLDMASAYDIAFKYEILNEVIASIDGFISRNYPSKLPRDIAPLHNELWNIYHDIQVERDMTVLDGYDKRLLEIRDYVQKHATKFRKFQRRVLG